MLTAAFSSRVELPRLSTAAFDHTMPTESAVNSRESFMPNQLAGELSLYLRQHAENPVDWRPWSPDCLRHAAEHQKPVFLSIGYSSCHWCHVMADESFSDAEVASLLNERFVPVKVDREQRPDLDQIFMEAVQLMTNRGGWPLSIFLTPSGEPFFGGTYWPLKGRDGIPGFADILRAIDDAWRNQRSRVDAQAALVGEAVRTSRLDHSEPSESLPLLREQSFAAAEAELTEMFDPQWGGFGRAPKFPQAVLLLWLVRRAMETQDAALWAMLGKTVDSMAAGGIFDHLGGGFHRYSTDAQWLVPHFEKMLYDNALLAQVYAEAWRGFRRPFWRQVAEAICDYMLRDLRSAEGGFFGSEDADSEHEEGRFYLWTPEHVAQVLGDQQRAARFCREYGVFPGGNFEGRSILHLRRDNAPGKANEAMAVNPDLADDRAALLAARSNRVRPLRDDKIIAAWNGLAIGALARCGEIFNRSDYIEAATAAAVFVRNQMTDESGRLWRCWRAGHRDPPGFLDDYASVALGYSTLAQVTGQTAWQSASVTLADSILAKFADPAGGFFYIPDDHEPLFARKKDVIDSAEPSGNGLAATLLFQLSKADGDHRFRSAAARTAATFADWLRTRPTASPQMLIALGQWPAG